MPVIKGYIKAKNESKYSKAKQAEIAFRDFVAMIKAQCKTLDDTVGFKLSERIQAVCGNVMIQYNSYKLDDRLKGCEAVVRADVFVWTNKRSDNGESKWHKIMSLNVARVKFFDNGIQEDTEYVSNPNDIAKHLRGWF